MSKESKNVSRSIMAMVNRPYVNNDIPVFHKNFCQFKNWRQDKNRKRLKKFTAQTGNKHKSHCEVRELMPHFTQTLSTSISRQRARRKNRNQAASYFLNFLSIILVAFSFSEFGVGSKASWNAEAFKLEGTHTSYAQFRKWFPSPNASIQFEFLTSQPDGVLLYTDDGGYYDFIELKLVDGSVRLRYNLGGGARVLHAGKHLHIGEQWHSVQFIRKDSLTILKVDGENATSSKSIIITPRRLVIKMHY